MAWIEFVKSIAQNVMTWLEKLKCQFTCCNSYVNVRVFERKKTFDSSQPSPISRRGNQ